MPTQSPQPRILIVEDDPDISEILCYNLSRASFAVSQCSRGDRALERIRSNPPDLLILDLMLPGLDGLDLARLMKQDPRLARVPVLMVTARSTEIDRIVGLELGADDYLSKPFSPREVVLRVKAILRRTGEAPAQTGALCVGDLEVDRERHAVSYKGRSITLTATEFRLLQTLAERAGRVQTRDQLLSDVWGYTRDSDSRTVDTHVRRLRRKLDDHGDLIQTVIGVGYRLVA